MSTKTIKSDALGTRMKRYEAASNFVLPIRSYVMIRIDGKAFKTYTKGLERPYDAGLIEDMNETAAFLCKNIMGAKFAYVQSDEISILLTDFDSLETQAWYDNQVQKMVSIAASTATAIFNQLRFKRTGKDKLAMFDARVFVLPNRIEVENYLIWRQKDGTRNSISAAAQALYSTEELKGVGSNAKQELLFQKGINWNDYTFREKRGGIIAKRIVANTLEGKETGLIRTKWRMIDTPIFTQDRAFFETLIPNN